VIEALLPVVESFGFSQELLTKTSGNASIPSLVLSDEWKVRVLVTRNL
jgi:translation elongation factor EF-G